jgi:hypothetical protein
MKKLIFAIVIVVCFSVSCKSQSDAETFISDFFEDYAPCGEPLYCYDYSFEMTQQGAVITTELYNFPNGSKDLTETVEYTIPKAQLKEVDYSSSPRFTLTFYSKSDPFKKVKNGKQTESNFVIIDFNKNEMNETLVASFKKKFEELINR